MSDNPPPHNKPRLPRMPKMRRMLRPPRPSRFVARVIAVSWRDLAVSMGPILAISAAAIWLAIRLIQPAPPSTLTISAGPPGSSFWNAAQRYRAILARNGVTLKVLSSAGSLENLQRLSDPDTSVDVGFVQSGVTLAAQGASAASATGTASGATASTGAAVGRADAATSASVAASTSPSSAPAAASQAATGDERTEHLVSLGSVTYVPLVIFYEGRERSRLSSLRETMIS